MRDTQRRKVYTAERSVFPIYGEKFTLDECKEFVLRILNSEYYVLNKGFKRITVKDGRGCRNASYRPRNKSIVLPLWARNPFVICHEMAHALAHKTVGVDAGHHASFCTHYVNFVSFMLSPCHAIELAQSFDRNGVLYRKNDLLEGLEST